MYTSLFLAGLACQQVVAFPWAASVDPSLRRRNRLEERQAGSASTCPYNANHPGAAPTTSEFPYCGASGGVPGTQLCSNNIVPAPGDTAHQYEAPGPNDIRGPCPGLNTAANHHFISHDGITTFDELVDMQQNVYGVGYDLAVLLAAIGVGETGDPVTQKMSIGCDATTRTASLGLGPEVGLDGHNEFEGDASLTRNDYFLANGDNFGFNSTLYSMMSNTCQGSFDQTCMKEYRFQRYQQSLADNGQFYFGPKAVLLYGAASFLYQLFPSGGPTGPPNQANTNSFFMGEQIPPRWLSRGGPYTIAGVAAEITELYAAHPVAFGGNAGQGNFIGVGGVGSSISNSMLDTSNPNAVECLLYQIATEEVPTSLNGETNQVSNLGNEVLSYMQGKIAPIQANSPCPINYNNA